MFKELLDYLLYKGKEIVSSRLFLPVVMFIMLFGALIGRMYSLQLVQGEAAEKDVQSTTTKTVYIEPTRGNIYDCNGVLLAYNKLVQNVTVVDDGSYPNGYERNHMILRLIDILDRHHEEIIRTIDIYFDEDGILRESFSSQAAKLRFLRDMYGKKSVDELSEEQKSAGAKEIMEYYVNKFGIGVNADKTTYELDPQTALKCVYIRYALYMNYYRRYNASTVAQNISDETVAAIRENAPSLLGVDISQSYTRCYNYAEYFCHIIGYTGLASADEIESLNARGGEYENGDVIGKTGLEAYCELELRGKPGYRTMYINNMGQIKQVIETVDPVAGDDIYLAIDVKLQSAIYHLIEQKLAGVLCAHLVNYDADPTDSDHFIPIKQAYYQLLGNHVLDISHFADPEAGDAEARLYAIFHEKQQEVLAAIGGELLSLTPSSYQESETDMQDYLSALYDMLLDRALLVRDNIDTGSPLYEAYREEGSISLQEYLREALELGWVDLTQLSLDEQYTSSEEVYRRLVELILTNLENDRSFSCEIYKKLIYADKINRSDIALTLFEQGVLEDDPEYIRMLKTEPDSAYVSYKFLYDKIDRIEITPAQLALDPYSGASTITEVASGRVLAMVSYPGYDNGAISKPGYYSSLLQDASTPLFNTATQAQTPPGSIFKIVTSAAALESGTITNQTYLHTSGLFEGAGLEIKCWYYPNAHGDINVIDALKVSCNDFFCQVAYRFSLTDGVFNDSKGLILIREYAQKLGLGEKSGVEVSEYAPYITDTSAVSSAIGQGTNLFANSQLARYITTVATEGSVYKLTLLDHRTDTFGELIETYRGELDTRTYLEDSTWEIIKEGLHQAVSIGSSASVFSHNVDLAGKTGTAKENAARPNHATFVSYAPYDNPEITVSVTLPHGYTSGNAAEIGGYIYDYYYGFMSYEEILEAGSKDAGGNQVNE